MTTSRERGIIFDLDGVLVDSMPAHIDAWISAFRQVAGVSLDRRLFYELEGMRGIELVEKVLAERGKKDIALAEKVVKEKDRIFHSKTLPPPFEGVKDMVSSLRSAKAVVSGSSRRDVEAVLDSGIGKDLFDVLVTADDVKKGKPDPLSFAAALRKLGVPAGKAVVVENAPLGVLAANRAGIPCYVALNNTLLSPRDFDGLIDKSRIFDRTSSLRDVLEEG